MTKYYLKRFAKKVLNILVSLDGVILKLLRVGSGRTPRAVIIGSLSGQDALDVLTKYDRSSFLRTQQSTRRRSAERVYVSLRNKAFALLSRIGRRIVRP